MERRSGLSGTINHQAGESVIGSQDLDRGGSSFHMHGGDLSIDRETARLALPTS